MGAPFWALPPGLRVTPSEPKLTRAAVPVRRLLALLWAPPLPLLMLVSGRERPPVASTSSSALGTALDGTDEEIVPSSAKRTL